MFYEKLRDSNFTSISFLKSNKFITTLYKYNSNQYIDNFIDTKKIDSKIVFLNKNELIIGETIFHKSKKEKELNFENFKQFKFYPEIRSDNYYYDIDTLSYNKLIPLYDNPISVSNKIMARIGLDIKLPITFSTEYYCYNEFDKFYLVGYNYDETSDSYKSKSFIKEADYKAYFIKLR